MELVGEDADAVLIGGADEGEESMRVFSYMNLARAFGELSGRRRSLLPPQEPLVADVAWAAARLGSIRRRAGVRGRRRGDGAREAEPRVLRGGARGARRRSEARVDGRATTSRPTSRARRASACGRRSCGRASSGLTISSGRASRRTSSSTRSPSFRSGSSEPLGRLRVGIDLIEIERFDARSRAIRRSRLAASRRPSGRTATRGRTLPSTTLRASPARRQSARRSASASRGTSPGGRSRSRADRSRPCAHGPAGGAGRAARRRLDRSLDDPFEGARRGDRVVGRALMFEPLYTADEMREAEAGHDVTMLMERAGRAVAEEALRRFPDARSFGALAERARTAATHGSRSRSLRAEGREAAETLDADVAHRRPARHRVPRRARAGCGGAHREI